MRWIALGLLGAVACGSERTPLAGNVWFGTLKVEGGSVSTNTLTDKLSQLHPVMEGCYKDALLSRPSTAGVIDMQLKGERTGMAVDVTKNTVGDESLTQCIVGAVKGVDFVSDTTEIPVFVASWSVNFEKKE